MNAWLERDVKLLEESLQKLVDSLQQQEQQHRHQQQQQKHQNNKQKRKPKNIVIIKDDKKHRKQINEINRRVHMILESNNIGEKEKGVNNGGGSNEKVTVSYNLNNPYDNSHT